MHHLHKVCIWLLKLVTSCIEQRMSFLRWSFIISRKWNSSIFLFWKNDRFILHSVKRWVCGSLDSHIVTIITQTFTVQLISACLYSLNKKCFQYDFMWILFSWIIFHVNIFFTELSVGVIKAHLQYLFLFQSVYMLLILHITGREVLAWFQAVLKKYFKQKATFDDISLALEKGCFEALLWGLL